MSKDRLWLLLITLIAFALRLTLLDKHSLWYDEGVTWLLSQMQLPDLIAWTAADIQPPLYYLLIWSGEIIIDASEWALRFPSVLFDILTLATIYPLANRLFGSKTTARLALFFWAISPVMIYYSQEARMYTLLVFEDALVGYLLIKILHAHLPLPSPYVLLYALVAAAALYTHYFAAFLLIAHALYTLFYLWQRDWSKPLLRQTIYMFGLTALLFAPWLPTLLARLGDDPSYWPGALKLDEALRNVAILFSVGETVFERQSRWLALIYGAILLIGGGWVVTRSRKPATNNLSTKFAVLFVSLWLCLPIIFILALSYQSPKFNPRYTLLAYPAFILLLAWILTQLTAIRLKKQPLITGLLVLFIGGTSAFSLYNWFTDRRFSKDDFRALAQFVHERIAANETVLLSSGHLFPVWAYYYGWDNWTPLPWMQRLDVNRVTDLSIASDMAEAITGKTGVWLITWQAEVIDPNGVVPFWLDLIGQRPHDAGDFWGVGLEHWRLDQDAVARLRQDPIDQATTFNFANQVDLVGLTQLSDTDIALFWRPRQPLPDDVVVTLDLSDKDGFDWDAETVTGRPGSYFYPPSRWPVGGVVMTRHSLNWQIGAPPGLYVATIEIGRAVQPTTDSFIANAATDFVSWDILDEQNRPLRRTALIDFINLSHSVQPDVGPLPIAKDPLVDFLPIVAVRRSILPEESAEPGDRILLALVWQAGEFNLDNIVVTFDLIDTAGQTFRVGSSLTPSRQYNLLRWQPGELVLGQYWLDIPPEVAPGSAKLDIHLVNDSGFFYDERFPLDELEILPTERNFEPPTTVDMPIEADFSDQATLIGADCPAMCQAQAGESISLTLYWRADALFDKSYTIFTHLLGFDETVLVNADHTPSKPTLGWVVGEIITDPLTLTVPADLPPGEYALEVGLYDAADPAFTRLPLTDGTSRIILPKPLQVR